MGPERLSTEKVYHGKVFDIRIDEIRDGDVEYKREIVVHKGSCVVIPVFEDGTVAVVRQYRHAAGKHLLEICAGTLNEGEDPQEGAIRELEEEIGVRAGKVEKLTEFYVSPGFLTEKMHVYLATELTETQQNLEEDEILSIERHSIPALLEMVRNGEIEDAKTMVGVLLVATRVRTGSDSDRGF
ncbi:MAG TPA: NUDIX hydrolase [Pyrinomonadaceae bacterium]|nr:NUDIX hydrolase [Pyrinomonadaceae bacterium]